MNDHIKAGLMTAQILGITIIVVGAMVYVGWLLSNHPMILAFGGAGIIGVGVIAFLYRMCLHDIQGTHHTFHD